MIHDIKDKVNMYMMSIHLHGYFSSILTTIHNPQASRVEWPKSGRWANQAHGNSHKTYYFLSFYAKGFAMRNLLFIDLLFVCIQLYFN